MTKLEEIARAIYEKRNGKGCYPWSLRTKSHRDPYLSDARAAIEAMKKHDEPLREAAKASMDYLIVLYNSGDIEGQRSGEIISTLDAALSEGKETET